MRRTLLLALLFLLAACDGLSVEDAYPPPGDYPLLTVAEAFESGPGRYNVDGYVERIDCGDDPTVDCLPGTNLLFEHLGDDPPQVALLLVADEPEVFREEVRYRLSVETDSDVLMSLRPFRVIGAAEVELVSLED